MEQYCLYLRKSRADAEAEARGEGETLARHEKALLELAKRLHLNVTEIYREIVSGETIAARPVMQQLLSEVEQGVWSGVLVMEVERLARGDTIDQGIVAQTFKYSDTRIITPVKTYDPNNEYDEEYFEFGLFMARREYNTIKRRLQRGRVASIKEGKYSGNVVPYGYEKVKIKGDKGYTLVPVPEEADVVRLIFRLYSEGEVQKDGTVVQLGCARIANRLTEMGIKPRNSDKWSWATVSDMLRNPTYAGFVHWQMRKNEKRMVDGSVKIIQRRAKDFILAKGLHEALVPKETWDNVQEILSKYPPRPVGENQTVRNPLAGLVVCSVCGRTMIRRYSKHDKGLRLHCNTPKCPNVSSSVELVEARILSSLRDWLNEYKVQWESSGSKASVSRAEIGKQALAKLRAELLRLEKQLDKTHDLLEQGVYDTETFLSRSRLLAKQISSVKEQIATVENSIAAEKARAEYAVGIIPKIENLLNAYSSLSSPLSKNNMLKEVLEKVVYTKTKNGHLKGASPDDFEITIYPKISHSSTPGSE